MHRGYIKIWRKVRDSWLIKDPHAFLVFSMLLINAEWQDGKTILFNGKQIVLKAGQLTAGSKQLAKWTGLTRQNIRTATQKLKSTNIITTLSTNQYTLFSIVNFNQYQGETTNPSTNKLTNDQPTGNQRVTTLEEYKHLSIKEKESTASPDSPKKVSLTDIQIKGLNEPAKHKLYNDLVETFDRRGWRTDAEFLKPVFKDVASSLESYDPRSMFPYFKAAMNKYINMNAEYLQNNPKQKEVIPQLAGMMAGIGRGM